ncbi:QueT transporter family protein [Numidum massiliense]|uniref:QueT transporter family protein n=1 Tax=Numidum massiliense TaxID=1522315 RepID=UPI0006D532B7|nr:QueT transporter family protein [Numidum massiliense]
MARKVAFVGVIAAIYVTLTLAFAPLSYSFIQFRISEVMTVLPFLTPLAVPGLFIGALIANLFSPLGALDVIFGSLSSLIAAYLTYKMPSKWLAPLPPVIVNAVIIGAVAVYTLSMPADVGYLAAMAYVGLGQLGVCYGLGLPVLFVLLRLKERGAFQLR